MIRIIAKLKYKLFSPDVSIPPAEKVMPIALTTIGLVFVTGIGLTIFQLVKKPHVERSSIPAQPNITAAVTKPLEDFNLIITRNIFNLNGLIPDSNSQGAPVCTLEPFKSNLPYKISGILYGGSAKNSLVVLEGQNKNIFKLGESLPLGGTLTDIQKNRILITNKNCPEYIDLNYPDTLNQRGSRSNQSSSGSAYKENGFERAGNNTTVTRSWINNILTYNFAKTLEEAKANPNLVGGQVKGFSITNITPDSVYSKLGLKDGDIVSSINGIELNDAARAIQTLNSLRNENNIEIQLLRGGQTISLKVNVQ